MTLFSTDTMVDALREVAATIRRVPRAQMPLRDIFWILKHEYGGPGMCGLPSRVIILGVLFSCGITLGELLKTIKKDPIGFQCIITGSGIRGSCDPDGDNRTGIQRALDEAIAQEERSGAAAQETCAPAAADE